MIPQAAQRQQCAWRAGRANVCLPLSTFSPSTAVPLPLPQSRAARRPGCGRVKANETHRVQQLAEAVAKVDLDDRRKGVGHVVDFDRRHGQLLAPIGRLIRGDGPARRERPGRRSARFLIAQRPLDALEAHSCSGLKRCCRAGAAWARFDSAHTAAAPSAGTRGALPGLRGALGQACEQQSPATERSIAASS